MAQRPTRSWQDSGPTVTQAIYDAGFNSCGRFYETSDQLLGMTPTVYRAGGADAEIRFAVGECSLGSVLVAQSAKGVCAITLGDDPDMLLRDLQDHFPRARLLGDDAAFEETVARVIGFVEQPALGLDLPLDVRGTDRAQRVRRARALRASQLSQPTPRSRQPRNTRTSGESCTAQSSKRYAAGQRRGETHDPARSAAEVHARREIRVSKAACRFAIGFS